MQEMVTDRRMVVEVAVTKIEAVVVSEVAKENN